MSALAPFRTIETEREGPGFNRIIQRMMDASGSRTRLEMEWDRDFRRTPFYGEMRGTAQQDLRDLYMGLRRLGFEVRIEPDYNRSMGGFSDGPGAALEVRYGHLARRVHISIHMVRHSDGQELIHTVLSTAQRMMMEVAVAREPSIRPRRVDDFGLLGRNVYPPMGAVQRAEHRRMEREREIREREAMRPMRDGRLPRELRPQDMTERIASLGDHARAAQRGFGDLIDALDTPQQVNHGPTAETLEENYRV